MERSCHPPDLYCEATPHPTGKPAIPGQVSPCWLYFHGYDGPGPNIFSQPDYSKMAEALVRLC